MDIATGQPQDHPSLLPLDATGLPAVAEVTPATPVASGPADAGPLQGGVMPTTAMFGEQAAAGTADAAAAMHAGMSAETDRRAGYAAGMLPVGASYGDTMDLPPGYPDSGTVGGLTSPEGFFYTPPREGAPETHTAAGNEP
jgi:hypothetical protein